MSEDTVTKITSNFEAMNKAEINLSLQIFSKIQNFI